MSENQSNESQSNDLVPQSSNVPATISSAKDITDILNSLLPEVNDPSVIQEMSPAFDFLPYLVLVQGQSPLTLAPHRISAGNWAFRRNKDDVKDLGETFDAVVFDWRPKAMHIDKATNRVQVIYDKDSDEFTAIQEAAKARTRGYFWGYEFLVYLGDLGEFALLYCNNPTLQNTARAEVVHFFRKIATLKSKLIEKESLGQRWFGFTIFDCSSPLQNPLNTEQLVEVVAKFRNPSTYVAPVDDDDKPPTVGDRER